MGSQERRRTESRRFLVINALRLGFWTHPGVYVKLFPEQISASHMFCLRGTHSLAQFLSFARLRKSAGPWPSSCTRSFLYRANADCHSACRHQGRRLLAGAQLLYKRFLLVTVHVELVFRDRRQHYVWQWHLAFPSRCLRPPRSGRCHVQQGTCRQRRASRCGNGYGLIWTLSWLAHGCSAKTTAGTTFSAAKSRKHRKYRCIRCLHFRASTTPPPPKKRDRRDVFGCKVHETP